jgi:hypothetical protein
MAEATATNGYLRMVSTNTFTAPGESKMFQPRALVWAGATTAAHKAAITDADGVTVCYLSVAAAGESVVLDEHYFGGGRPWKTPITATLGSGMLLITI